METGHHEDVLYLASPLGTLVFRGDGRAVTEIALAEQPGQEHEAPYLREAANQVEAFLDGHRRELTFPIAPRGTEFQKRVWNALREIPYGQTDTYGNLAARIGNPGAARAVGTAAGKNPILLAIPCHRLLAANGLGGFSCGLERKRFLLRLEGKRVIDN